MPGSIAAGASLTSPTRVLSDAARPVMGQGLTVGCGEGVAAKPERLATV